MLVEEALNLEKGDEVVMLGSPDIYIVESVTPNGPGVTVTLTREGWPVDNRTYFNEAHAPMVSKVPKVKSEPAKMKLPPPKPKE